MRISKLRQMVRETLAEMALPEMARTAGTGGELKITDKGKKALTDKSNEAKLATTALEALYFVASANKKGERVQKKTFADSIGKPQPAVNPLFNKLVEEGFLELSGYTPASSSSSPKPKAAFDYSKLADLDLGEDE